MKLSQALAIAFASSILFGSLASAQVAVLVCESGMRGRINELSLISENDPLYQEADGVKVAHVDAAPLIEYTKAQDSEIAVRVGVKVERRTCGPYVVAFSASWLNDNPNGEVGGEQYATVELWKAGKRIAGPFTLALCYFACISRSYDPKSWATSISFDWSKDNLKPLLWIDHSYSERREIP